MQVLLEKSIKKICSSRWLVFTSLCLLALIVRFFTLFPLVIDHDESTYLVMANEWLKGGIPFVDFIDIKPIGIYGIYAISTYLFGQSILAVRLLAILAVSLTALFIFMAGKKYGKSDYTSLASSVLYIILISLDHWGWSGNTELYFNVCTAASLFLLFRNKTSLNYVLLGFIMGIGFIIKYHVIFDFLAFLLLIAWLHKDSFKAVIKKVFVTGISFVIPFCAVGVYYFMNGHIDEFLNVSFVIPGRYSSTFNPLNSLAFFGKFYLVFLPISILYCIGCYKWLKQESASVKDVLIRVLWPVLVWIAILMTGKMFSHYYIQALIPFSFMAFDWFELKSIESRKKAKLKKIVLGFLSLLFLIGSISQFLKLYHKEDYNKTALEIIRQDLQPSDKIHSQKVILHYLLDRSPHSRFVHPSIFYNPEHIKAFGLDLDKEYALIRASNSKYVYCYTNGGNQLKEMLLADYELVLETPKKYNLWRKKDTSN